MDHPPSRRAMTDVRRPVSADTKNSSGLIASAGEKRQVFNEPNVTHRRQRDEDVREQMTLGGWQNQRASAEPDALHSLPHHNAAMPAHHQASPLSSLAPSRSMQSSSRFSYTPRPRSHPNSPQLQASNHHDMHDTASQLSSPPASAAASPGPATTQRSQQQQPQAQASPVSSQWAFTSNKADVAQAIQNATPAQHSPHGRSRMRQSPSNSNLGALTELHDVDESELSSDAVPPRRQIVRAAPAMLSSSTTESESSVQSTISTTNSARFPPHIQVHVSSLDSGSDVSQFQSIRLPPPPPESSSSEGVPAFMEGTSGTDSSYSDSSAMSSNHSNHRHQGQPTRNGYHPPQNTGFAFVDNTLQNHHDRHSPPTAHAAHLPSQRTPPLAQSAQFPSQPPQAHSAQIPSQRTPPLAQSAQQLGDLTVQHLISAGAYHQHEVPRTSAEPTEYVDTNPAVRSNAGEAGGYDVFFIDPLRDAHRCPICKLALRTPVQTSCGHRFCKTCIDAVIVGVEKGRCPIDNDPVERTFADKCCEREVLALAVRCNNYLSGCEWSGQVKDLQDHMVSCRFSLVRCPHNGCEENAMLACDLLRHTEECRFRPVPCRMCRMNVPQAGMNDHLMMECMECPVICPNGCGSEVKRKDLERHRTQDCSHVQCMCPYRVYSCMFEGTRDQVDHHCQVEAQHHIAMVAVHSKALGDKLDTLHRSFSLQQQTIALLEEKLIEEHKEVKRLKEAQKPSTTPTDPTALLTDSTFKAAISNFIEKQVQLRMSDRMADLQKAIEPCEQRSIQANDGCQQLRGQMQECNKSLGQMGLTAARSDAALAEVDLRLLAVETNSYNGLIIFKINNFARRHEEARTGRRVSLYSPTFYTSRHGYKVCLRVYLNGDGSGKGTHISVFFTIMKGEFDSLLEWPFRAKVTFAVLDQGSPRHHRIESFIPDPQSSSFQRPVNDMNIASGCPKMVSHSELYDKQSSYLRDDCLYIKASVDQSVCGRIEA